MILFRLITILIHLFWFNLLSESSNGKVSLISRTWGLPWCISVHIPEEPKCKSKNQNGEEAVVMEYPWNKHKNLKVPIWQRAGLSTYAGSSGGLPEWVCCAHQYHPVGWSCFSSARLKSPWRPYLKLKYSELFLLFCKN